jgi:hypothetical protein
MSLVTSEVNVRPASSIILKWSRKTYAKTDAALFDSDRRCSPTSGRTLLYHPWPGSSLWRGWAASHLACRHTSRL